MRAIANRKVSWPRAADYRKTYMYMWFKKFAEWSILNNLDDDLTQRTVVALVKYAKHHNILRKGAALLKHEKIYEIALKEFDDINNQELDIYHKLRKSHELVNLRRGILSSENYLTKANGIGQLPNIVLLFNANLIVTDYLALSSACRKALKNLNIYRTMLPSDRELFKIRELIEFDKFKSEAAYKILGSDYINSKKHLVNN